ncbi:MAG TPA: dockerin type I repeat-containing protein, partial [Chthoniobacterales bacterium]
PDRFDISPPLTELAATQLPEAERAQRPELELPPSRILRSDKPDPVVQVVPGSDSLPSSGEPTAPDAITSAATGFNFEGIDGSPTGATPPDNNGSVGNDQFVEMVNSRYQVWSLNRQNKTASSLAGPANINTLFANFGGHPCQTRNNGDPVVLYDKVANRWLLSQFTSGAVNGFYYQCVAISTTPNAAGTYYRYAFAQPNGQFGDYPHYGVWSDAYYVQAHQFTSSTGSFVAGVFAAMDRTKMLAGDATATWQVILDPNEGGHMAADLDGFAPPPANAPGIFTSIHSDGMYLYRMKVDFSNAANTTRTLQAKMPIAAATAPCGGAGGQCIPQPNSPFMIDSLGDRLMFRLAYRNFIDHESLVITHAVDPGVAGVVSGVRWYEFRISGQPDAVCSSYPCTYQQGTIADGPNGRSRWMPSIAQDGAGNMIVGYSTTGSNEPTDAHSIRYTGRASNHPLGTMTVPETIIFTGQRNIPSDPTAPVRIGRWGDYTSTSIDPADDCTFWHVNEYYGLTSTENFDWRTRIASASFNSTQCQPSTCTSRPATAPMIGSATVIAVNQIEVTWTGITPTPGSYAIERAIGAPGSEGLYQPIGFVSGAATSYIDKTVQGGVTYSYRVIAATDGAGKCQSLVHSDAASATATGNCNFKPSFGGLISASSIDGPSCGVALAWAPGTSNCPLAQTVNYNVYRGLTPDFVPSAGNRVASCIPGPSSYFDTQGLTPGHTYFYVVRAEDNSTGHGGACDGTEEQNNVVLAGTPYGAGTQATPGTWTDGGGDFTSFLKLNAAGVGNILDPVWRFVRSAEDAGANHTLNGDFAYRNAGPAANDNYGSSQCAAAQTPVLTVGGTSLNLTYWERHQLEKGWDGVAIEYSRNGGPWTDVPAPSNATADGCLASDITADYATLQCSQPTAGEPVLNACGYPVTKPVITGPNNPPLPPGTSLPDCTAYMTGEITNYGRRCHRVTGLTAGDTIQFRWRFTSDPGAEFKGFYLDDIGVTNVRLPNDCTTAVPGLPVLAGAASRASHDVAGDFDAPMPLDGTGVEPRNTGGAYTVVLHFDRPIASGNVTVTGTRNSDFATVSGNDILVSLTGVANKQRMTFTASNVTAVGGGVLGSASVTIGFLIGDINGDTRVNIEDTNAAKSNSGSVAKPNNFRADVNVDSRINVADTNMVKANSGMSLPAAAPSKTEVRAR